MAKNRWLIAASAVGIHASLGSVYAWSVLKNPFIQTFGWSQVQAGMPFALAIFMLGMSAAFMGHVVERRGPRYSGTIAAIFWSLGLICAGLVTSSLVSDNNVRLWLLYGCCVIAGLGLGTGYVTPVSTLLKWFPDRRGLATGLAIMGFGFGGFFGAKIMGALIAMHGLSSTFLILGGVYAVVMLASSQYLEPPPADWKPEGFEAALASGKKKPAMDLMPMTANQAVKTWPFYGLWIMMFLNITCGISLISVASPMTQEVTGMSVSAALTVVGLLGIFNGGGRLAWASLSDLIGRPNTYIAFFLIEMVAFYFLPSMKSGLAFQAVLFLIITCYGGCFSTLPAYIGDVFGTKQVSAIQGYLLTAWALAGMVGSSLASYLRAHTGSYTSMSQIYSGVFVLALIVGLAMRQFIMRELDKRQLNTGSARVA